MPVNYQYLHYDLIQCSEAEAKRQKQERAKLDMLAANERQMQLKASPCLCLLQGLSTGALRRSVYCTVRQRLVQRDTAA